MVELLRIEEGVPRPELFLLMFGPRVNHVLFIPSVERRLQLPIFLSTIRPRRLFASLLLNPLLILANVQSDAILFAPDAETSLIIFVEHISFC